MSLIVETGAIVAGANSLVSLDWADAYFEARGDAVWAAASDDNKEYALIMGTDYMQARFRMKWRGYLVNSTQRLSWPRRGVPIPDFVNTVFIEPVENIGLEDVAFIDPGTIPDEVKQATCILARATMDSNGSPTVALQASLGRPTKSEQLGTLAVTYMSASDGVTPRETQYYWDVENLLKPFLKSKTGGRIVRS